MRGRPRKFVATLTPEEKERLLRIAHATASRDRRVERARIILLSNSGHRHADIAEMLAVSRSTVSKVIKRWSELGADRAIEDMQRSGRPPTKKAEEPDKSE